MPTAYESVLIECYKEEMVAYLNDHPEDFGEAIRLAVADSQPYAWRSAWLLWSCMDDDDPRIRASIDELLRVAPSKSDGHQRELIKILLRMNLSDEQEGRLFNLAVGVWEDVGKKPSVRFTAFKFIHRMGIKYPDLQREIGLLTSTELINPLSPGVRSSILKMIRSNKAVGKIVRRLDED